MMITTFKRSSSCFLLKLTVWDRIFAWEVHEVLIGSIAMLSVTRIRI